MWQKIVVVVFLMAKSALTEDPVIEPGTFNVFLFYFILNYNHCLIVLLVIMQQKPIRYLRLY